MMTHSHSWAMRLAERRARTFVGREAELRVLRGVLEPRELAFQVIALVGPPGCGKTTLLRLLSTECHEAGVPHAFIDARAIQPSTDALLRALRGALHLSEARPIPAALAKHTRFILVIDNYDAFYPLHDWLCEKFFPQLPASTAVLLGSRKPLPEPWRTDPAWRELVKVLELGNLSEEEARTYLRLRAVPQEEHERLIAFSRGHPLALSLAVDLYLQRGGGPFDPDAEPGLMQALVRRFMGDLSDPPLRAALEACAVVRVTTEAVLSAVLGKPDVRAEFDWLCSLSFVDFYSVGIYPHDLVRDVLLFDMKWRNPDRLAELRRRALEYYAGRLQRPASSDFEDLIEDYLFLHRDHAVFSPFLRVGSSGAILPTCEPATAADHRQMVALLRRWEGDESARLLARWLQVQPSGAQAIRDDCGNVAAFMFTAELDASRKAHIGDDPIAHAIWEYLERCGFPADGGVATLTRFVVVAQNYQELSPELAAFAVAVVQHCLTVPDLKFSFNVLVHPERWEPLAADTGFFPRVSELNFEVGGRPVGVFMQDWRAVPPDVWLKRLAGLPGTGKGAENQHGEAGSSPSTQALMTRAAQARSNGSQTPDASRERFDGAVRHALKHYHVWDMLASNPLVDAKIVHKTAGPGAGIAARVQALQDILRDAVEFLGTVPTRERLYRALHYTYLEPQGSQEQTAEFLNLPFSTYRGHLRAGIRAVADLLWHKEADL